MPIHFNDRDVVAEVADLREKKPFIQLVKSFLKSAPYEDYITTLQSRLQEKGVKTKVFKSAPSHEWFMCMWTLGKRKKLQKYAENYDAVIVLGCDSAVETVREALKSTDCKLIEGMEVAGIMNAEIRFHLPGNVSFENCKIVPISQMNQEKGALD